MDLHLELLQEPAASAASAGGLNTPKKGSSKSREAGVSPKSQVTPKKEPMPKQVDECRPVQFGQPQKSDPVLRKAGKVAKDGPDKKDTKRRKSDMDPLAIDPESDVEDC